MGVTVCLPLFGNAGQELEEGAVLRGQQLRDRSTALADAWSGPPTCSTG